jgi:hypothetical protein
VQSYTEPERRKFLLVNMHAMETLYFDILQFVYHLALAILVGGALVLGMAAAQ